MSDDIHHSTFNLKRSSSGEWERVDRRAESARSRSPLRVDRSNAEPARSRSPLRDDRGSVLVIVLVTLVFATFALTAFMHRASGDLIVATRDADARNLRKDA